MLLPVCVCYLLWEHRRTVSVGTLHGRRRCLQLVLICICKHTHALRGQTKGPLVQNITSSHHLKVLNHYTRQEDDTSSRSHLGQQLAAQCLGALLTRLHLCGPISPLVTAFHLDSSQQPLPDSLTFSQSFHRCGNHPGGKKKKKKKNCH